MNYDLWFIMLEISNRIKYELIDRYETCENIYNNFEYIVNSNNIILKKLEKYKKDDFYEKTQKIRRTVI